MSCVLGIETGRGLCSAALWLKGGRGEEPVVHEEARRMQRAHNECILALVDKVFTDAGLGPRDIAGVAFGCGPGSFTGIRLSASVAQAVALGAGTQVLPVSSTYALAVAALEEHLPVPEGVVVSIRSRRDACYLASFAIEDGQPQVHRPAQLLAACPDWAELAGGWPFVGDAPSWLPAAVEVRADVVAGAGCIARLGAAALAKGRGLAPEFGLPAYIQGDTPWRPRAASPRSGPAPDRTLQPERGEQAAPVSQPPPTVG